MIESWTRARSWAGSRLIQPGAWWVLALAYALHPLGDDRFADPPWGKPWHVGRGLLLLGLFGTAFALTSRTDATALSVRRRRACTAAALFVASIVASVSNFAVVTAADNLPSRALPVALLEGRGTDLGAVVPLEERAAYSLTEIRGRLTSAFPLGTGLLAVPYYAALRVVRPELPEVAVADLRAEKHLAALLTATAVILFFLATAARFRDSVALVAAAVLAFATPALSILAQGLWSHTGELLLLSAALLAAAHRPEPSAAARSGLFTGAAVLCRPTAILMLPVVWPWISGTPRRRRWFVSSFAFALIFVGILNFLWGGSFLGASGGLNASQLVPPWNGGAHRLALLVASPSRGLIWFFPSLVFALLSSRSRRGSSSFREDVLGAWIATLALLAVTTCYTNWWGGSSLGPRLLAELALPAALVTSLVTFSDSRLPIRLILAVLVSWQLVVTFAMARSDSARRWNETVNSNHRLEVFYSLRDSQLAAALVPGWRYRDLSPYLRPAGLAWNGTGYRALDLRRLVNGRYGSASLSEGGRIDLPLDRLARFRERELELSRFRLLPAGRDNLVRVCEGESTPDLALDGALIDRVSSIILWRSSEERPPRAENRVVVGGTIILTGARGGLRRVPLRVGKELFDPDDAFRAPPVSRLVAGNWGESDSLVGQEMPVRGRPIAAHSIRVTGRGDGGDGCLYILAMSLHSRIPPSSSAGGRSDAPRPSKPLRRGREAPASGSGSGTR